MSRAQSHPSKVFLVVGFLLATAIPSRADIGVVVLEPIGPLGFFTRVGHASTYLSNICPDGSPIRMRLCHPGERGGVVSKYTPFSANADYDWAIVPLEEYLHGFGSPELEPMIATPKLQSAIERHNFDRFFSRALTSATLGEVPDGEWKSTLATRFDRGLYIYSVRTTVADDATIVAAFNAAPNKSQFNFFYRNCSNQAKEIFDLVLSPTEAIGDRTSGVTMETPKGLAKSIVARALEHPEFHLQVRRYAQLPGTFSRSRDALFPMENAYKNIGFAPYWLFGGFREVALAAMFYHEVLSPFDLFESSKDFISPRAAQLTQEQHRLRRQQDEIGRALAAARNSGPRWWELSELYVRVLRRLGEIKEQKQAEVNEVTGSKAHVRELDQEFQTLIRAVDWKCIVPDETLVRQLTQQEPSGNLSETLLHYVDAKGEFYIDGTGRGPWIRLPLGGGEMDSTGLSASHVLTGNPRLAVLVLAAVLDYNLHESDARREGRERLDDLFTLFRQASGAAR